MDSSVPQPQLPERLMPASPMGTALYVWDG